ncbi:unnamed protein product [Calypogeia fissa]
MNKECCDPGPAAKEYRSGGYEEKCWGLDVYFNWPAHATKAIVLVSDVFGWKPPLLRTFADKIAAAGLVAVVPDYFRGDTMDLPKYATNRGAFLENNPFEPVVAETLTIIKGLKDKGIKSVGIAGFCYGGKVATLVASKGTADAAVLLHPSRITLDDMKQVKGAIAILSAELDKHSTVSDVDEWKQILESRNEVELFVKIYPGVDHGWTVRYDENDEKAVKSAYEAQSDAISWFQKHLK